MYETWPTAAEVEALLPQYEAWLIQNGLQPRTAEAYKRCAQRVAQIKPFTSEQVSQELVMMAVNHITAWEKRNGFLRFWAEYSDANYTPSIPVEEALAPIPEEQPKVDDVAILIQNAILEDRAKQGREGRNAAREIIKEIIGLHLGGLTLSEVNAIAKYAHASLAELRESVMDMVRGHTAYVTALDWLYETVAGENQTSDIPVAKKLALIEEEITEGRQILAKLREVGGDTSPLERLEELLTVARTWDHLLDQTDPAKPLEWIFGAQHQSLQQKLIAWGKRYATAMKVDQQPSIKPEVILAALAARKKENVPSSAVDTLLGVILESYSV